MKRIRLLPDECVGCGNCTTHCPRHLTTIKRGRIFIRAGCTACGECVKACGYYAIRLEDVPEEADEPSHPHHGHEPRHHHRPVQSSGPER